MLLDFDGEMMKKAGQSSDEPQRPPYLIHSMQPDLPAIHCNVALEAPGQDPANLPDFPEGLAMVTLTLGWAMRNPIDGFVHFAGVAIPAYFALSLVATIYQFWQIDCKFGIFVRCCFLVATLNTFLATATRIHFYKLAPYYKTVTTELRKQAENPYLRTRMAINNTMKKTNTIFIGASFVNMYFLFLHTQDPSCNTLCCTEGGVALDKGLETGGGAAIMVPDATNRKQMMLFLVLPVLNFLIWNQFSRDPVEDQTIATYMHALKQKNAKNSKHGGG